MFGTDHPGVLRSEIYWLCDDCAVMFKLSRDPQTGIVSLRKAAELQDSSHSEEEPAAKRVKSAFA